MRRLLWIHGIHSSALMVISNERLGKRFIGKAEIILFCVRFGGGGPVVRQVAPLLNCQVDLDRTPLFFSCAMA